MNKMFCFQCQQTAHNTGCEGNAGVCGKKCGTANAQDALTNALIGLARAVNKKTPSEQSDRLVLKGLFTTITNVNFHEDNVRKLTQEIQAERNAIDASAEEYDIRNIWENHEDIRSLKSLILFGLRGMAAYAYHALALGYTDRDVLNYFYEALAVLGEPSDTSKENFERLLSYVLKTGEVNYRCMELLDKANTESYGTPVPTEVPLTIEKGPFIVVSGHDLHDLKLLLEQTNDTGINIYTHSEMLPAHGYPELKKYPHLKGNFGTAWQNQQFEFHNIPAPILFTTNCLMPVRQSYCDRVFTTSIVSYPELIHIGEEKDFTPVIEKALECGGYGKDHPMYGVNGGNTVMTGFAHGTVLKEAGRIINLVKNGKIRHFFLIQDRKDITKFLIHIIDLCQIMGKQLASLGNIYIHRRQRQFVRIKLRGIALIPGSMRLIGGYKQTERFAFRLAIGNKFLDCFKIQVPTFQRRYIKVERKY